jgi:hypothetical protein
MAATLTSKITLLLDALFSKTNGLQNANTGITKNQAVALTSGVGANQADLCYVENRTIAASGTATLDLAGVLLDIYGATITFARIKAILIFAAAANTNNVLMGGAGANAFIGPFGSSTDTISTKPGGITALVAPDATAWAVTAATADLLKFTNSAAGTGVTYDLVIVGASA